MFFYTKLFNKIMLRPSMKFYNNIFLLKHSLSLLFTHNSFTHIFLITKNLKIKFFKNKTSVQLDKYITITFLIVLLYLIIFF